VVTEPFISIIVKICGLIRANMSGTACKTLQVCFSFQPRTSASLSQLAVPKLRGSSTCAILIPARDVIRCLIQRIDQMSYLHVISCCNLQLCSSQIAHVMQCSQHAQQAKQNCYCGPCATIISCDQHASSIPWIAFSA